MLRGQERELGLEEDREGGVLGLNVIVSSCEGYTLRICNKMLIAWP